jgi:dihydroneopterin aldolase
MVDKILLHGAHFFGKHGVSAAERRVGGRYVVDIEVAYDLTRAAQSDDLAQTISYSKVYDATRALVEGKSFRLIEALAEALAQTLLARFPADAVLVRVKKEPPPTAGIIDYAGVEIVRVRRKPQRKTQNVKREASSL